LTPSKQAERTHLACSGHLPVPLPTRLSRSNGDKWLQVVRIGLTSHDVDCRDEGCQRAREAIAKERRDARDTRLRGCHDFLSGVECARPHNGRDHQTKLGGKADPDPLPPLLAAGHAFPYRYPKATPGSCSRPRKKRPSGKRSATAGLRRSRGC
jgi:hypothetical protein